jgi:spermidine synthase
VGGFTTVKENIDPLGNTNLVLYNSGKPDASTLEDMSTQTLMAHVPMCIHPAPKRVMVLGLASGMTGGEVLHYPVDRLDIVEINRQAVAASDLFRAYNNDVLQDPRTHLIVQDGRAHLQLTNRTYDIIISAPSNLWMAGMASLYSVDLYATVRSRLDSNEIFVQFFHSYEMDRESFDTEGRSFMSVFPHTQLLKTMLLWLHGQNRGADYLFVGYRDSIRFDLDTIRERIRYAQKSSHCPLHSAETIALLVVADNTSELFGTGPLHTDNRPILEYTAPKNFSADFHSIYDMIHARNSIDKSIRRIQETYPANSTLQLDYSRLALAVRQPFSGMFSWNTANENQRRRYGGMLTGYAQSKPILRYDFSATTH